jgi:hypothetical protein
MSNTATNSETDHEAMEADQMPLPSVEEAINDKDVSSHQILKTKKKLLEAMVKEKVAAGMSEEDARKLAVETISAVVNQKRE